MAREWVSDRRRDGKGEWWKERREWLSEMTACEA